MRCGDSDLCSTRRITHTYARPIPKGIEDRKRLSEGDNMKYKIVEVPWINYEVQCNDGEVYCDDDGNNVFETREEAQQLIKELKETTT